LKGTKTKERRKGVEGKKKKKKKPFLTFPYRTQRRDCPGEDWKEK